MKPKRPRRAGGAWAKDFLVLLPGAGAGPTDETAECLVALRASLEERGLRPADAVKLTFFVRAQGTAAIDRRKREVAGALRAILPSCHAAVGVVAQAPEGERDTALEAVVLRRPSRSIELVPKRWRGLPYIVLRGAAGREVVAGGLSGGSGDLGTRTAAAFAKAAAILAREGLGFADIARQWNFIEDITGRSWPGRGGRQNYQIFNDIRADAYAREGLTSSFPAATGVGVAAGGFVLEFIAGAGSAAEQSCPVSNPLQSDAHRYSPKVLAGPRRPGGGAKRTPKFERARVVFSGGAGTCYVSGTAAIVGEDVVHRGDAAGQTRATVRNIRRLVAAANLRRSGAPVASVGAGFSYVRTYVKDRSDLPEVARIVQASFPGAPSLLVTADVCRGDLLVEIEGAVEVVRG